MQQYVSELVLDPTEALREPYNLLADDAHFANNKIAAQSADKMIENQEHAYERDYFENVLPQFGQFLSNIQSTKPFEAKGKAAIEMMQPNGRISHFATFPMDVVGSYRLKVISGNFHKLALAAGFNALIMISKQKPLRLPSLQWFLLASMMLCTFCFAGAQTYTYKLTSSPDSATVFLNDVEIGKTPMDAKFEWTKSQSGPFVFMFLKPGFEDAKYVVTERPKVKDNYKDVKLEKKHPRFAVDSNAVLVKFDKLMTEFPLGKQIGHNKTFYGGDITWEAYSRVGVGQFATKADDVLGSAGFRTPFIQGNELFSDQTQKPSLPRFLVGGKLLDIWVELGPTTLIGIKAKNWCTIQWQVYDKVLNKVVLTTVSRGEFDGKYTNPTELNVMMDLFQDAMENFLFDGQLFGLVQSAAGVGPVAPDPAEADPKK